MPRFFLGLVAAPLLLVSSSAFASNPCASQCAFVPGLDDISQCSFEVTGGCTAECTPISVTAQCDGQCTVEASASCTGDCGVSCMGECTANPGSFDCDASCKSQCESDCQTSCAASGGDCVTDCQADCGGRCQVSCEATPPSASCEAQCQASCQGSCNVQANVDCNEMCSASVQGGCTASCKTPQGALFCNGQYVDPTQAASCYECLLTNINVSADVGCTDGVCTGTASVCSASPAIGASQERWGVFGITSLVVGLGLITSRRRRRA
jgi:hypothetical protein